MCQPKSYGGLGLRALRDHNTSFIMKLGFKLVIDHSSLWVKVLQSKYGTQSGIPESLSRGRCSFLWRSLSKIWPLLLENLLWSIGDRRNINCWKDTWVPNVGPLFKKRACNSSLDMDLFLSDIVTESGELFWGTTSGAFAVKSAYKKIREDSWNTKEDVWNLSWKYNGPQRVRVFIWLVLKHRLLNNVERIRRGLCSDIACGTCSHSYEDILHVLGDCKTEREIWMQLIPTDSSVKHDDMFVIAGGLLRDQNRFWILGFTRYLGNCEVIDSKLWGILDGLQIAFDRGFQKVIIRSDNLEAVNIIHTGVCEGSNSVFLDIGETKSLESLTYSKRRKRNYRQDNQT
ncbi:hypothetical protein PVK06_027701 [Gossypium arboreum]|uniref:Uncharacterized protein n=1 Tax=Gossypium arboreum TaxID=29729 RepID=A0ABR0P3U2_GOSAR|nr:hypothetical protein PVK06_027701 [Gossypium arboreum]